MLENELFRDFAKYTICKIEKFFPERSTEEISCICDIECGIMLMFFDFPFTMSVENLLKLNENIDKYLYSAEPQKGKK